MPHHTPAQTDAMLIVAADRQRALQAAAGASRLARAARRQRFAGSTGVEPVSGRRRTWARLTAVLGLASVLVAGTIGPAGAEPRDPHPPGDPIPIRRLPRAVAADHGRGRAAGGCGCRRAGRSRGRAARRSRAGPADRDRDGHPGEPAIPRNRGARRRDGPAGHTGDRSGRSRPAGGHRGTRRRTDRGLRRMADALIIGAGARACTSYRRPASTWARRRSASPGACAGTPGVRQARGTPSSPLPSAERGGAPEYLSVTLTELTPQRPTTPSCGS